MSAIQIAAQRINSATAGLTGSPTATPVGPERAVPRAGGKGSGAVPTASPVEALDALPTEFGGLTHLFGGEAAPSQQYEPMTTAVTIPGGSVRGPLGGLKPDFQGAVQKAIATVSPPTQGNTGPAAAPSVPPAISAAAKNGVARIRSFLKI
jgi:hypothetical protein